MTPDRLVRSGEEIDRLFLFKPPACERFAQVGEIGEVGVGVDEFCQAAVLLMCQAQIALV